MQSNSSVILRVSSDHLHKYLEQFFFFRAKFYLQDRVQQPTVDLHTGIS